MITKATLASEVEGKLAIEYLFSHNLESVRGLLTSVGLSAKGDADALRQRVTQELGKKISLLAITQVLDTIEGWGNQHVILYRSTSAHASNWKKPDTVTQAANALGLPDVLNATRPMLLPDNPTLSQVIFSPKKIRFVWVQKKIWHARREDEDYVQGNLEYRAYEVQTKRGIYYFDWNLLTNEAALLMQVQPKATEYKALQAQLWEDLKKWMATDAFELVSLKRLISKLEVSKEVTRRNLLLATAKGSEVEIKSEDKKVDAYDDQSVVALRKAMKSGGPVASKRGFFYWLTNAKIASMVPMRVYPRDNRFSFHGQFTEQEIQYVLSRVRAACV